MATEILLKAIAVTAELTATQLSAPAARVMAEDLARYPEAQVLKALTRCRREVRSRLTIADVVSRLDDGRPGAEEAWAMLPKAESETAVWTDEMSRAFGVCLHLIEQDQIAARMAFREAYGKYVQEARDNGAAVKWTVSLGHDAGGREAPLLQAVELGRLSIAHARALIPDLRIPAPILKLIA